MAPTRTRILIAFLTLYVVWGSTYLGIRVAVSSIPPFLMASLRFLTAGTLMVSLLRLRGPLGFRPVHFRDSLISGAFLLVGGNGLLSWAEQYIPSGAAALFVGTQPLFIVLADWLWGTKTRPGLAVVFALLLGFGGVAWLASPGRGGPLPLPACGAILGACVCWACGSIYGRRARSPLDPLAGAALQMLLGGAVLALLATLSGEFRAWHPGEVSRDAWLALAYLTTVGSLVGFSSFVWLLKHSTPTRVATYAYVNPIVAVFLGWLLLDEKLGIRTLACGVAIVASVAIITLHKPRTQAA